MKRLTIVDDAEGMHPSERLVTIDTVDGREVLFVDKSLVERQSIPVGYPVGRSERGVLVELPRETMTGCWRVWVNGASLMEEYQGQFAGQGAMA